MHTLDVRNFDCTPNCFTVDGNLSRHATLIPFDTQTRQSGNYSQRNLSAAKVNYELGDSHDRV